MMSYSRPSRRWPSLLIVACTLLIDPVQAAASTVRINLRAELDAALLSFSLLPGDELSLPDFERRPPSGWVTSQLWVDPSLMPLSSQFFTSEDLSIPIAASTENALGFARASQESGRLEVHTTSGIDSGLRGYLSLNAIAVRSFDITLHGVGTLILSVPFELEAGIAGPQAGREVFGYASVGMNATRRRADTAADPVEIDYSSGAMLPVDSDRLGSPFPLTELLTVAVPFIDGDTVSVSLHVSASSYLNAQLVPLPAGPWPFATLLMMLASRAVRHRTP